jgi:hypothetical protein
MRHLLGRLSALAVCLGVACGVDVQGLGPSSASDSGAAVDASVVNSSGVVGNDGGFGTVAMESGAAASNATDAAQTDAVTALANGSGLCGSGSVCPQGQQCDPVLGCVVCTTDLQCPASARFCLAGSCVQCKANTDCGNGTTPSCWPGDHQCHVACTSNQQCPQDGNARICNVTTGACVGCSMSSDCPTTQSVCDPTTLRCVQCASSADCAGTSTPVCSRNRCGQCATNADCSGATPYCATGGDSVSRCVQCLQSAQCPASVPSCNGGTCGKSGG